MPKRYAKSGPIAAENPLVRGSVKTADQPRRVAAVHHRPGAVADERNQIGAYIRIRREIAVAEHVGRAEDRDQIKEPRFANALDLILAYIARLDSPESERVSKQNAATVNALS